MTVVLNFSGSSTTIQRTFSAQGGWVSDPQYLNQLKGVLSIIFYLSSNKKSRIWIGPRIGLASLSSFAGSLFFGSGKLLRLKLLKALLVSPGTFSKTKDKIAWLAKSP